MLHDKTSRRDFLKVGGATAASASLVSLESIAAALFNTFFGSSQVVAKSMGPSLGFVKQNYSGSASPYLEAIVDNTKDVYMIPQFVVGGNDVLQWKTMFTLSNKSGKDINAIIQTFDQSGNPLSVDMMDENNGNSIVLNNFKSGSSYSNSTKPNGDGVAIGYAILTVDKGAKIDFGVEYSAHNPFSNELLSRVAVQGMMIDNVFSSATFKKGQKNTGIAVANPNSFPIALYLDFRNTSSNLVSESHLQLNPGQQLPRFITELPGVNLPPDFEGTITVYSKDKFGATTLTLEKEVVSAVPASNNYHPVKQLTGKLSEDGKPVGSQLVTLTDSNYKNPATGQTESLAYKTFTDENGNFNIGLLRDFGGNLEMKIERDVGTGTLEFKRQVTLNALVNDAGQIRMFPVYVDEKGEDSLTFAKKQLAADGNGANTKYKGWDSWPIPIVYKPKPGSTQQEYQAQYFWLKKGERIIDDISGAPTLKEVTTLPTLDPSGKPYLDQNGKPTSYGIEVEFRNGGAQSVPVAWSTNPLMPRLMKVWLSFSGTSSFSTLAQFLHEIVAHTLHQSGDHASNPADLSADGGGIGLPTIKEGYSLRYVRNWPTQMELSEYTFRKK